jgi:hypothetical protein
MPTIGFVSFNRGGIVVERGEAEGPDFDILNEASKFTPEEEAEQQRITAASLKAHRRATREDIRRGAERADRLLNPGLMPRLARA